jgi:hypothetical protein
MALDVHILASIGERPRDSPRFWFDLETHDAIFFGQAFAVDKYPQLYRMVDYYCDTTYHEGQLQDLIRELDEVIPEFREQRKVQQSLKEFSTICKDAYKLKKVVFLLGD